MSEATGGRRTAGYDTVLRWCDIFLRKGTSFDTFSGHEKAFALLYPMDVLYERYIGQQLKIWVKNQKPLDYEVKLQSTSKNLYDDPKAFPLRPDILLYKNGEPILIMDTKWKILNQDKQKHYGISQADMYQMFAYAQRFDQPEVVIIYPQTEEKVEAEYHTRSNSGESDQDAVHVSIRQFNLSYLTELDNKKRHTESEIREKIANELIPKEIREQITKKQIPS